MVVVMYEFAPAVIEKKKRRHIEYSTIAVSRETKKLVDERRKELGAETYDEALKILARPKGLGRLRELEGILKGTPPFVRDRRDRNFS